MAEDWTAIAAEVAEALGEFTTVTLIKPGAETGPENNPTVGPPTEHELRAVLGDFNAFEISGTLIELSDRRIMVEASSGIVPTTADKVRIDGETLEIVAIPKSVAPAGVPVMYVVACRG